MQNKAKLEQSSEDMVQKQIAGENSNQVQVGTVILNQGITEERARDVFLEMVPQVLSEYTQEAYAVANERIVKLENTVMPRMLQIDGALSSFTDPAFQLLLKKAQQSAAAAERDDDYALLSELIVCQVQKGSDRKKRTGISKAVEIVGEIDGGELCALTIAHAINVYLPTSGDMKDGLGALNILFGKLLYTEPDSGKEWLDHLDVLGAIRLSGLQTFKIFKDYYSENLNGYVCAGIKVGSDEYKTAIDILRKEKLDTSILKPNELLENYVKLPVRNQEAIAEMMLVNNNVVRKISNNEVDALNKIWNLYSKDSSAMETAKNEFMKIWDSYDSLKEVRIWWEKIPVAFEITRVGTVLEIERIYLYSLH